MRIFTKGEKYRPVANVIKVKKNIPTVLNISGRRYTLDHDNKRRKTNE